MIGPGGMAAMMVGLFVTYLISLFGWERGWLFKFLPILYGCLTGVLLFYTYHLENWGTGVGVFFGCVGMGAMLSLCAWLEGSASR